MQSWLLLPVLLSWSSWGSTAVPEHLHILLDGSAKTIELKQKSVSHYGIDTGSDQFFDIRLTDNPNSSGHLAKIDDSYRGLIIVDGDVLLIEQAAVSAQDLFTRPASARRFDSAALIGSCGAHGGLHAGQTLAVSRSQELTLENILPKGAQINYSNLCQDTVDGICLVASLNLIFDREFELAFGSSFQSEAISIIEIVNNLYDQFFDIRFATIRFGFRDADLLTSSENIVDVYNDMLEKRLPPSTALADIDPNPNAIFHFISGRDYLTNSNGTIGVAAFPQYETYPTPEAALICTPVAVGTSQVFGSGSNRAQLTALVVAHELGHNFGFDHDGEIGSEAEDCSSSSIMGAFIDGNESSFSACSYEALVGNLNSISSAELCLSYPVSGSIIADNETQLQDPGSFDLTYQVTLNTLTTASTAMTVRGEIRAGSAQFLSSTLAGTPCDIALDGQSYQCTAPATTFSGVLDVTIDSPNDDVQVVTDASFASGYFELSSVDNSVTETISFRGPGLGPGSLAATVNFDNVLLNWSDRATDETGYTVERQEVGGSWVAIAENLARGTSRFRDTSIRSVTNYNYRVTALFSSSANVTSETIAVSTGAAPKVSSITRSGGSIAPLTLMLLILLQFNGRKRQRCQMSTACFGNNTNF